MRVLKNIFLVLILIGIAVRLALPYVIRHEINKQLRDNPDYGGYVEGVRLSLVRGAVRVLGIHVHDRTHDAAIFIPIVYTNISWKALIHKKAVISILIKDPRINVELPKAIDQAKARAERQKKEAAEAGKPPAPEKPLPQKLRRAIPFRVDSFAITNGQIYIESTQSKPPQVLWLRAIDLDVSNLTNSRELSDTLMAKADLDLKVNETGSGEVRVRMNPVAHEPTFSLKTQFKDIHLPDLNPIFRHQFGMTVDSGTFSMFVEAAAAEGAFRGYVKPVLKDLQVANPSKGKPLKTVKKVAIQAVTNLLSSSKKELATKVPIEGRFDDPKIGLADAVINVLSNALSNTILPRLTGGPSIGEVKKESSEIKEKS